MDTGTFQLTNLTGLEAGSVKVAYIGLWLFATLLNTVHCLDYSAVFTIQCTV